MNYFICRDCWELFQGTIGCKCPKCGGLELDVYDNHYFDYSKVEEKL